ncbi:MAG: hypothetical protein LBQ94_05990, partial [Treponema sp.]|nr:hypothetical protein [Treponema sp.]
MCKKRALIDYEVRTALKRMRHRAARMSLLGSQHVCSCQTNVFEVALAHPFTVLFLFVHMSGHIDK